MVMEKYELQKLRELPIEGVAERLLSVDEKVNDNEKTVQTKRHHQAASRQPILNSEFT